MSNIGSWKLQSHCRNNPERNGSVAFLDFCAAVGISTVFLFVLDFVFVCVMGFFVRFCSCCCSVGFCLLLFFNMFYFPLCIGQLISLETLLSCGHTFLLLSFYLEKLV